MVTFSLMNRVLLEFSSRVRDNRSVGGCRQFGSRWNDITFFFVTAHIPVLCSIRKHFARISRCFAMRFSMGRLVASSHNFRVPITWTVSVWRQFRYLWSTRRVRVTRMDFHFEGQVRLVQRVSFRMRKGRRRRHIHRRNSPFIRCCWSLGLLPGSVFLWHPVVSVVELHGHISQLREGRSCRKEQFTNLRCRGHDFDSVVWFEQIGYGRVYAMRKKRQQN